MSTEGVATIEVFDELEEDVSASAALLHFQVTGNRLFTGAAALKEAVEVKRLVEALTLAGLPEKDVRLEGVSVQVSKGILTRTSQATYRIRATLRDLPRLAAVLDAVSSLNNCQLAWVDWEYDAAAQEPLWLERAVPRARAKAEAVAKAIGKGLGPVLRVQQRKLHESTFPGGGGGGAPMMYAARSGGSVADELSGLELAPTLKLGLRVEVVYAIA